MKKKTVFGLTALIIFTAVLFMNFGEQVGGYMNFAEAEASGAKAHVVGTWVEGSPMRYDPSTNVFTFTMQDDAGNVRLVEYRNPKPANFEDADQLVIEGYPGQNHFVAENILVKCPSKYNDGRELEAETVSGS